MLKTRRNFGSPSRMKLRTSHQLPLDATQFFVSIWCPHGVPMAKPCHGPATRMWKTPGELGLGKLCGLKSMHLQVQLQETESLVLKSKRMPSFTLGFSELYTPKIFKDLNPIFRDPKESNQSSPVRDATLNSPCPPGWGAPQRSYFKSSPSPKGFSQPRAV